MAEVLGAIASVVTLIGTVVTLVQQVQKANDNVKGTSKTLDAITAELEATVQSLNLVMSEEALQTAGVTSQVENINCVTKDLESILEQIRAEQKRSRLKQLAHAVKAGDLDEKKLQDNLRQLDSAKQELVLRICLAQVGLLGDMREGLYVVVQTLMETNAKVKETLGRELFLAERIQERYPQQTGKVRLNDSDMRDFGLRDEEPRDENDAPNSGHAMIYENVTLGQARIMTGDVGVEEWHRASNRKTTIKSNRFEGESHIMTGDVGGEAARDFNKNFWN